MTKHTRAPVEKLSLEEQLKALNYLTLSYLTLIENKRDRERLERAAAKLSSNVGFVLVEQMLCLTTRDLRGFVKEFRDPMQ